MTEDQIPEFVDAVVALGCDICAVGERSYVVGDADLPLERYEQIRDELGEIEDYYGERDHLRFEIIAYLKTIGRHLEVRMVH